MKSLNIPGLANFAGISADNENGIHIDGVIQKAFMDINEVGTEAAGASYVKITANSLRFSTPFVVDRPFLAFIHDGVTNTILFFVRKVY